MNIEILKAKIHRATITSAELDYEGSLSIDENLMKAAGIYEYEKVLVANISNGSRAETYAIKAAPGSGEIGLNGGMARLGKAGELVILLFFCHIENSEAKDHKPALVFVDNENRIMS